MWVIGEGQQASPEEGIEYALKSALLSGKVRRRPDV
jgi:hypothetical protein